MNRIPAVLMIVLALASIAGTTEREVALADFDLEAYAGQVVVVDFWASWCPPCREAMPWLSAMQAKYGDQGLVTVAVNVDQNPGAPNAMISKLDDEIIVVRDPEGALMNALEVQGLPTAFVIGRDGTLRSTHVGFNQAEKSTREDELKALLAETVPGTTG